MTILAFISSCWAEGPELGGGLSCHLPDSFACSFAKKQVYNYPRSFIRSSFFFPFFQHLAHYIENTLIRTSDCTFRLSTQVSSDQIPLIDKFPPRSLA